MINQCTKVDDRSKGNTIMAICASIERTRWRTAAGSSDMVMLISLVLWFIWPRKLMEMCASILCTLWSKGLTIGAAKHQEHACQPASARLRGSRDNEHKIGTYIFHLWSYFHETLQRHVQLYRWWYSQRMHPGVQWINGNVVAKNRVTAIWTAGVEDTSVSISRPSWIA
jgi:hypothetical protein